MEDTNYYWDYWTPGHTFHLKTNYSYTRQYSNQYGLELWGSAEPSNSKPFNPSEKITKAPFYVSLDKDLNIPFVHDLPIESYNKFHNSLNPPVQNLSLPHLPQTT
jgi:hypothetical protein